MTVFIRAYRLHDFDALYTLWQNVFGSTWPISREYLRRIVGGSAGYQEGDNLLVEEDGRIVGFITTQIDPGGKTAEMPFVMVSPEMQRQGIGRRLHYAALEHLSERGVETLGMGLGNYYFWRGVPPDLTDAVKFFEACGWQFNETDYDLTQDLRTYTTPSYVLERAARQNISIRQSTPEEIEVILQFERRVFPDWGSIFQNNADAARYNDILVAWDGTAVVGTLLMEKAVHVWHKILGDDMGIIGVVGVDDQRRGQGIGLAMVARASEILRERGVGQCFIGWTDETVFYGKLGYKIWRSYAIPDPLSLQDW